MNIKGLIVSSSKDEYKTYDCEISIPALKIHIDEEKTKNLLKIMPKANYTSIMFMIEGNPVEVSVYRREDNAFYANAKEIAQMNLTRMPKLKENSLVKKFLDAKMKEINKTEIKILPINDIKKVELKQSINVVDVVSNDIEKKKPFNKYKYKSKKIKNKMT